MLGGRLRRPEEKKRNIVKLIAAMYVYKHSLKENI